MGLFSKSFYRYTDRNFVAIRADELREGDFLSLASWGLDVYGAVELKCVTNSGGEVIVAEFIAPEGACVKSSKSTDVDVSWDGSKAIVKVERYFHPRTKVLVLA